MDQDKISSPRPQQPAEAESPLDSGEAGASRPFPAKAVLVACAVLLAIVAAGAAGAAMAGQTQEQAPAQKSEPAAIEGAAQGGEAAESGRGSAPSASSSSTRVGSHVHKWVEGVESVRHDAEVETVEVPDTYKTEIVDATVCNACGADVTGKTAEHTKETGHSAFTTDVPVERQVVDVAAHTEEKVVKEAFDEDVPTGVWTCSECGATRTTDPNSGAQ